MKGLLRACVGECTGNHSVGRPLKRWIDTVKIKVWISSKQGEWCMIGVYGVGVCEWKCMGRRQGDEPLTLTRSYSCELPQLNKDLKG